ncbi:hypothetical protein M0534_12890 [Methylonatrum kenyense]|uniref:hypothetical protein n=1 Tax=Methylonatrum kenyense TaxID=455253 RepID=UPI0020BFEB02|nr:hypothetical protein [Methylonatrum kenyense]MCK8517212.1 hypothetical protein [Methylonatrum kenyense]
MRQRGSTLLNTILILLIIALLASVAVPTWQASRAAGQVEGGVVVGFSDKEGFRFSD